MKEKEINRKFQVYFSLSTYPADYLKANVCKFFISEIGVLSFTKIIVFTMFQFQKKGLLMFRKYLFICESSDCLILQFLSLSHRRINIQSLEDGLTQMELIVL